MKTSIHIQFRDDVNVKDVENTVKEALKAEGLKISSLKKLDIYYKPQENAIYYVAIDEDDNITGSNNKPLHLS
ncbi:DUF6465 family protein [Sharpea azabuensis]|uniref:DUF6465 family protein n=1 Tax=Sharpea azabuensis TaxID=322505 RepID=UPI00156832D7|nr:DUF6465 family protein [Sharpea azabuensis]MEE3309521.1 DUF6465 family protein [Sharpea azabuensis]